MSDRGSVARPAGAGGAATLSPVLPTSLLLPIANFNEVDVRVDPANRAVWAWMAPKGPPSFTHSLLRELNQLNATIADVAARGLDEDDPENFAPRFFAVTSKLPGIFNLGGDLEYFVELAGNRDRQGLLDYAYASIRCIYEVDNSLGNNVLTICIVQGDALGGGFEAVLSFNVIIAERGTKMGLPEVIFNAFPGMGAYSLLSRKIGAQAAEPGPHGGLNALAQFIEASVPEAERARISEVLLNDYMAGVGKSG